MNRIDRHRLHRGQRRVLRGLQFLHVDNPRHHSVALGFACERLKMDREGYTPTMSMLPGIRGHKFGA